MKYSIILLLILFPLFINAQVDEPGYIVKVGDMAPDFTMQLTTADTITLSELKGKLVMLQFTASWCMVSCKKMMPHIEKKIWQKHKDNKNFALFGIDRGEPLDSVLLFIETTKITYQVGLDPNASIFELYAEKDAGITRNIIIDQTGRIIMLTRLFKRREFNKMVKLIDEQLAPTYNEIIEN